MKLNSGKSTEAFFLYLIGLIVILPNFAWFYIDGKVIKNTTEIIFPALATVTLTLSLFPRLWVGMTLLIPWAFLAPLEGYYLLDFNKPSDVHLIGIISETNIDEVTGFFSGTIGYFFTFSIFIFLGSVFIAWRQYNMQNQWKGRSRYWVLSASIFVLLIMGLPNLVEPNPYRYDTSSVIESSFEGNELVEEHAPKIFNNLLQVYPVGVFGRLYMFRKQSAAIENSKRKLENFHFQATQQIDLEKQVYVLIIGETGRPDHWQLNGYSRQTTPRLMRVSRLLSFHDVISPWAWTRMAVPIILTRKPASDTNQFFPEKSLISAFNEAGFKTYWLSTQSPLGPHDSSIALHASEAHEAKYLNPLNYKSSGVHDTVLLDPFDKILKNNEKKVLVVFHILGGHFNYADRYPIEFDQFQPSCKWIKKIILNQPELKNELINSYDNSLLFQDFFISEVIKKLDQLESTSSLLYVADHGENIFDEQCDKIGHGRGTEYDFRVPMIWWFSEVYQKKFFDKITSARKRVYSPLTTSLVFHSMLDMADIRYPGEELRMSIFSNQWQPSSRITQDKIDFDNSSRDAVCKKLIAQPAS